jgi:hypothetical protein
MAQTVCEVPRRRRLHKTMRLRDRVGCQRNNAFISLTLSL